MFLPTPSTPLDYRDPKSAPLAASLIASGPPSRLGRSVVSSEGCGGAERIGVRAGCERWLPGAVSQREIAHRLGMNRRTVARLARGDAPRRYRRAPASSMNYPRFRGYG
jgi:hypothetical protein